MVCNGCLAGKIVVSQSLAITYKMYVQQPTKTFCNFMQKRLAKNIYCVWMYSKLSYQN